MEQTLLNLSVLDHHLLRLLLLKLLQRARLHQKPPVQIMPPATGHHAEAEAAVGVHLSQIDEQLMVGDSVAS